jgi:hypothetical protein
MGLGSWLIEKISYYLTHDEPPRRGYLCDFDRICYEVRPCDVLLIEGRNKISHLISRITHSPWSHAALYIGRLHDIEDPLMREEVHKHYQGPPGEQLVIESIIGKGTIISPLKNYHNDHIRVCRPTGLARKDAQKIINYAIKSVGKKYNLRQFFDLGRFVWKSHFIPSRWKSTLFQYNPGQATQDICSSMIAAAFNSVKFPILPLVREDEKQHLELIHRHAKLFTPSDFDYSPYFNIIKYPLFPVSGIAPYRNLPWHEGLLSVDEEGVIPGGEEKKSSNQESLHQYQTPPDPFTNTNTKNIKNTRKKPLN